MNVIRKPTVYSSQSTRQRPAFGGWPVDQKGFTLVELLIVVIIIGILCAIGVVIYTRANKTTRDSVRVANLTGIYQAVQTVTQESSQINAVLLCVGTGSYPCWGTTAPTTTSTTMVDGTGWVRVNFTSNDTLLKILPVDPLNNATYHYAYCGSNDNWEINAVLEADAKKMAGDGGDDLNKYEIGTDLTLIGNIPGCSY